MNTDTDSFFGAIPDMPDSRDGERMRDAIIEAARTLADAFARNDIMGIMLKVGDVAYHVRMYDMWQTETEQSS